RRGQTQEVLLNEHGRHSLTELRQLVADLERQAQVIDELARWTADLILGGARLLACGNGGSAAEAQHFASELVGRYCAERRPLPALALSADGSLPTCISNDYSPDAALARQVIGTSRPGGLLLRLGNS